MYSDKKYLARVFEASCRFRRSRTSSSSSEAVGQTKTSQVGFPIRTSRDQRVLSPPPGLSQSATSFIASCCQGIHQTPLSRLIRSRRRQALLRGEWFVPQPVHVPSVRKSNMTHAPPRQRGRCRSRTGTTLARQTRPLGQCLQTWKDCFRCPTASLLEDEGPRTTKQRTRLDPHSDRDRKRLVFCSLNDVNCRDLATGQRSGPGWIRFAFRSPPRPAQAKWWVEEELNLRPHAYQACALTT
jgi:hypothetical protein